MSLQPHSDAVPVAPGAGAGARRAAEQHDEQRDRALMARVSSGDVDAARELAERMAPRVERVARSLMGGSLDARDAAVHALIELLRRHEDYRGQVRLQRWADKVAARSVMRFARAVLQRDSGDPPVPWQAGEERSARTFDQYLGMLADTSRQLLLLRHALGFSLSELSDLMQCSQVTTSERLCAARKEFRGQIRRRPSHGVEPTEGEPAQSPALQRWSSLRDREALGEALSAEEREELEGLEARQTELWAFVAQMRALELYYDSREPKPLIDGELVERALAALEVSSPTLRPKRGSVIDGPLDTRAHDPGGQWISVLAWGVSALLAAASAVALYLHHPEPSPPPVREPKLQPKVAAAPTPLPIIEALPTARTASRGAKLRRDGRVLPAGSSLGQGDLLEAVERPGCLEIDPGFELCLAPGSSLRISSLRQRAVELVKGRMAMRGGEQTAGEVASAGLPSVQALIDRGAVALERSEPDVLRVRGLRGRTRLRTETEEHTIEQGVGALAQGADGTVSTTTQAPAQIQRDWELLATGLHANAAALDKPAPASKSVARRGAAKAEVEASPKAGAPGDVQAERE